ncbi:MAG: transglycosylase SLT domain-containing protein [Catalinimonas sp.]
MKAIFTFVFGSTLCLAVGFFSYRPVEAGAALVTSLPAVLDTVDYNPQMEERFQREVQQVRSVEVPVRNVMLGGEKVPMNERSLVERYDRELLSYTFWHSHSMIMIKRANRWFPQMEPILRQYGLPTDLKYVVAVESVFQNVVSPVGAVGFWQIMEETGLELGLEINDEVDERYHPIKSTHAAAKYLKQLRGRYGDYATTLAAYNAGMGRIERALAAQKQETFYDLLLNEETSRYVFRVLAAKEIIENPEKYGLNVPAKHRYPIEPVRRVEVSSTIDDLTEWAMNEGINYKILKQFNPWLRANRLTVDAEQQYVIEVPVNVSFDPAMEVIPKDTLPSDLRGDAGALEALELPALTSAPALDVDADVVTADTASTTPPQRPGGEKEQNDGQDKSEESKPRKRPTLEYRVRWYDTMARVARKHGVEESDIQRWNELKAGELARGQTLVLYPGIAASDTVRG